ncbi:MAG: hypothetical protein P1U37_06640 [Minwuia sp.]|nr:hypothetical protein [Minwuia sp.]
MSFVSQADYARRRGVSRQAISKAVATLGIPKDDKGRIDPDVADRMRGENSDPSQEFVRPGPDMPSPAAVSEAPSAADGDRQSYRDARAEREHYQAQTARLEYEKRMGQLLPRDMVVDAMSQAGTEIARALDALPQLADELVAAAIDGGANAVRQVLKQRARDIRKSVAEAISLPDDGGTDTEQEVEADNVDT